MLSENYSLEFIVRNNANATPAQRLRAASLIIYGFESGISGLEIVFEKANGAIDKYSIPHTKLGYANIDVSDYVKVWFEYSHTDKEYKIEVYLE
jgi:hypothetical protein